MSLLIFQKPQLYNVVVICRPKPLRSGSRSLYSDSQDLRTMWCTKFPILEISFAIDTILTLPFESYYIIVIVILCQGHAWITQNVFSTFGWSVLDPFFITIFLCDRYWQPEQIKISSPYITRPFCLHHDGWVATRDDGCPIEGKSN